MNQKFEYHIKKILNRVLLYLITGILLNSILITLAIIFKFRIGTYFMPYIYILIGLLLFYCVIINYLLYKKNMKLLEKYHDKELVKKIIEMLLNDKKYHFFINKHSQYDYQKALEIIEDNDE